MLRNDNTIHIDLHLPTAWNRCTTEELEAIAAAIIQEQQRVDRYHPFDWSRIKLGIVLSINEITVREEGREKGEEFLAATDAPTRSLSDIKSTYLVQRPQDKEPWPITTGQLVALTERIAWIDDEKADKTVFLFPYPTLDVRCKKEEGKAISHLQGPPPLLDGYTWREYRILTDWMQEYMRCANALAQSKTEDGRGKAALDSARNEFLAVLFKPKEGTSAISHLTSDIFAGISPVQWQVILFWWSSLMGMLARKFPRVFKPQPVGKKQRPQKADTPWDFYNRVTATIQKYIGGLSSQDVDNQPYGVTLQQLEMMADEAAEMEKLKKK